MEQRPAPLITITDPTRPPGPADVVVSGDERDPWRLRRGHYAALALVAALALAAVVPQAVVGARADDRRAALQARHAVQVETAPGGTDGDPADLRLLLFNSGPNPVQLLDLTVQAPGYLPVPLDEQLEALASGVVALTDTRTCGPDLRTARGYATRASLRVRTAGGAVVTRGLDLPGELSQALLERAQQRCRWLPPGQALTPSTTVARQGAALVVSGELRNVGHGGVQVPYPNVPVPGLEAALGPRAPITIPEGAARAFTVRMTISSCPAARGALLAPEQEGLSRPLLLSVTSPGNEDEVLPGELDLGPDVATAITSWVTDRCGPYRSSDGAAG